MHLITWYETKVGIWTPFSAQEKVQSVKCLAGRHVGQEIVIHTPNKTNIINIMFKPVKSFINIDEQTVSIIIISTVATNRAFFPIEW